VNENKIRILHLIETGGPGGAEKVLLNIVKHINSRQFSSLVMVPRKGWLYETLKKHHLETRVLESHRSWDVGFLLKLSSLIRKEKINLIHSHLPGMNFYSCLAGRITKRPVIVTYHGMIEDGDKRKWKNIFKNFMVRNTAAQVVTVSDYLKKELIKKIGVDPNKIVTLYSGIDFNAFGPTKSSVELRQKLGLPESTPLVGTIGNIRKSKGYEYLMRSVKLVVQKMPNVFFLIVGEKEEKLFHELNKLTEKLGLKERIKFLGFREDVADCLNILDIFVLSSTTEGFSIATVEAMSLAKPVVVTDCGGPREIVTDGQTGFLVPPGDHKSLAEKIILLLRNQKLREEMGNQAQIWVRKKFSLEENIKNYELLYINCMKRHFKGS
jgi:glycosyltransferase involved in cell wall biosynthesis